MNLNWAVEIIILGLGLLGLFIRTFVKSTVEKSVSHQFDVKLERFKQEFTRELHSLDRKDKYRLAALDRRLDAHQKAYMIARKMSQTLNSKSDSAGREEVYGLFDEFLNTQSLFLVNEARSAFVEAYYDYLLFPDFAEELKGAGGDINLMREIRQERLATTEKVRKLTSVILEAIDLESMAKDVEILSKSLEEESNALTKKENKRKK